MTPGVGGASPAAGRRRSRLWIGVALALFVAGLAWQRWAPMPVRAEPARHAAALPARPAPAEDAGPSAAPGPASTGTGVVAMPAAADPVERLWTDGSLRGSALDGDWGRWSAGRLQPAFGLRRRFDQLLSTQGEVALADLRRWIEAQVAAAQGPAGAAQVLDVWDRYLQVQSAAYALEANPNDPSTWQPALAEHGRVRRQLLGSAWAEAFYGAEERELAAVAARRQSGPAGTAAAPTASVSADALLVPSAANDAGADAAARHQAARAAQFGADAADRLQANDAAWQRWQQRVDAARAELSHIRNDPSLSPPQRREAEARLLNDRFADDERVRAAGLVGATEAGATTGPASGR